MAVPKGAQKSVLCWEAVLLEGILSTCLSKWNAYFVRSYHVETSLEDSDLEIMATDESDCDMDQ